METITRGTCRRICQYTTKSRLPPLFLAPCLAQRATFHRLTQVKVDTRLEPPFAANSTVSQSSNAENPHALKSGMEDALRPFSRSFTTSSSAASTEAANHGAPAPAENQPFPTRKDSSHISSSIKEHLPHLLAQPPFFAQAYIYGRSYLITAGDTVRLPFLMHGVVPGDILRLNRVTSLGSRDWTLRGGTARREYENHDIEAPQIVARTMSDSPQVVGKTDDLVSKFPDLMAFAAPHSPSAGLHRQGPREYLDDRLFVIRARVVGTESEPMRIKEKTKRRQRHVKHVRSKHKYTILRISEITVKRLEELE